LTGDRTGSDVRRRHNAILDDRRPALASVGRLLQSVGRLQVLLAETDVEEGGRVLILLREGKAVGYLRADARSIVVDVNLITDVLTEVVVVRSPLGKLERDVVCDDRHGILSVG